MEGIFSFNPLNGWYIAESLEPVATYIEDWREEDPSTTLRIKDSLCWGYRHYLSEVDSTLLPRVMNYLDATFIPPTDTIYKYRELSGFPHSRKFKDYFNSDIEAIKRYFATPLQTIDTILTYNAYHDNDFESLFHTFQLDITGADLSLYSPSKLDDKIPQELYIKNIASLLYFDNTLVRVKLTGAELKELMEENYSRRYYRVHDTSDDLLKHRVPAFLHLSLSDTPHTVNLTKRKGRSIENWRLSADSTYTVAMNSFLAKDYDTIEDFGDYKQLLIKWLKTTKNPLRVRTHTTLQPARIVTIIEQREKETIFGEDGEITNYYF